MHVGDSISARTKRAAELRKAAQAAYESVQKAHADYERVLVRRVETELSSNRYVPLQQQGRNYAYVVITSGAKK